MWTFYLVYSRDFCLQRHDFDLHFRLSHIHSSTLALRADGTFQYKVPLWKDQTNTLDQPSRRKLDAPIRLLNKAKRFANQLLSNVMNALAFIAISCEQSKLVGEEVQEKAALVFC